MSELKSNEECRQAAVNRLWNILLSMTRVEHSMDGAAGLERKISQLARSIQVLGGVRDVTLGRLESLQHFTKYALARLGKQQADALRAIIVDYMDMLKTAGQ